MDKNTTRSLSRRLEQVNSQRDGDRFISAHQLEISSFSGYLQQIISANGLDKATVAAGSGISRNYVYNILSGSRSNPGRDKVIALCIAAGMTYRQTQRGLEIAGLAPLYPRDERDVRIAIALNEGVRDVMTVNLILDDYGLDPLDV